jgi:acyl-CoA thioesterase
VTAAFTRQTAVRAGDAPGQYVGELTADWSAPLIPQGGIVTALALRAMAAELSAPHQRLRSVSTVFAAQVPAGPVEVDVTVLRQGRSASQLLATVHSAGTDAGHTSMAVFGAERPGFDFTDLEMPDAPPPEECPESWYPPPDGRPLMPMPYWENHVDGRPALGDSPWDEDVVRDSTARASWYRFREPPVREDGLLDPLAVVSLCDTMPGAVTQRVGFVGRPNWLSPSADLTVHLLGDAGPGWLLGYNRARHAGDGYASLEMELWDPDRGLVAYGTQMMFFSFPDGPPS